MMMPSQATAGPSHLDLLATWHHHATCSSGLLGACPLDVHSHQCPALTGSLVVKVCRNLTCTFLLKPHHMLHVQICKQHVEAGRRDSIDNMSEYVMQQRIDTCAGGMHDCCQIVDPVNAPMQFMPTEKS